MRVTRRNGTAEWQRVLVRNVVALEEGDGFARVLFRSKVQNRVQAEAADEREICIDWKSGAIHATLYHGEIYGRHKDGQWNWGGSGHVRGQRYKEHK